MVLPSNASPDIYPHNNASDFTIAWENTIQLNPDDKWSVALTEISYIYRAHTIRPSYGIRYHRKGYPYIRGDLWWIIDKQKFEFRITGNPKENDKYFDKKYYPLTIEYLLGQVFFYCSYPFRLELNEYIQKSLGFSSSLVNATYNPDSKVYYAATDNHSFNKWLTTPDAIRVHAHGATPAGWMQIVSTRADLQIVDVNFNEHVIFQNVNDLVNYIKEKCSDAFVNVSHEADQKINITIKQNVSKLEFLNNLHFVLGFHDNVHEFTITKENKEIKGNEAPHLSRGALNMFIYASICEPVFVGHVLAPLLKHVFIEAAKDNGTTIARNCVIIHPMYIPVATISLNDIQINIRDEVGRLFPFPRGSITTLTLHFKKG
jgi:hypothetical protein